MDCSPPILSTVYINDSLFPKLRDRLLQDGCRPLTFFQTADYVWQIDFASKYVPNAYRFIVENYGDEDIQAIAGLVLNELIYERGYAAVYGSLCRWTPNEDAFCVDAGGKVSKFEDVLEMVSFLQLVAKGLAQGPWPPIVSPIDFHC